MFSVYFSPTGGTKEAATTIGFEVAKRLKVAHNEIDITLPSMREKSLVFKKGDLVILGMPIIAGRIPNLLVPYLKEKIRGNNSFGVPVVSFGNRNYDDGLIELSSIMVKNEFLTVGGGGFVSEHSFSNILGKGRPDKEDKENLKEFGRKIAEKLGEFSQWKYENPVYIKGNQPFLPYFMPKNRDGETIDIRKAVPVTGENCCGCGICAEVCPLGSISKENTSEIIGICMKCCACVKKCPVGAKKFIDTGFIYHKEELEILYAQRKSGEYFL